MKRGLMVLAVNLVAVSLFAEGIVINRLYDGSILYTFNASGEVEIPSKGWIDVLVVGGGGAGGGYAGGGGGGGAVVQRNAIRVEKGTCLEAIVGLGGGKMPDSSGVYGQGQDSAIPALGIVAAGGGAGGGYHGATPDTAKEFAARSGGAGGGARAFKDQNNLNALERPEILAGAVSIIETGFAGGSRMLYAAGGGGGAGARGGDAFLDSEDGLWAGKGGDGIVSDITGDPVYYGGGGGGGARADPKYWYNTNGIDYVSSMGGLGGGGMGRRGEANAGVPGVDGLGGGGGGGGGNYHVAAGDGRLGGHGGDGVVIIRFTPERFDDAEYPGVASITYEDDGSVLYTFTETGIFSPPCEGTADVLLVGGGGGGVYFNGV